MIARIASWLFLFLLALNVFHTLLRQKNLYAERERQEDEDGLSSWLSGYGLSNHESLFRALGFTSLRHVGASSRGLPDLGDEDEQRILTEAAETLARRLALRHWLIQNGWTKLSEPLEVKGVTTLQDLKALSVEDGNGLPVELLNDLRDAKNYLPEEIAPLEMLLRNQLEDQDRDELSAHPFSEKKVSGIWTRPFTVFVAVIFCITIAWEMGLTPTDVIWGVPLHKSFTRLDWPDDAVASNTKTLNISFYDVKGKTLDVGDVLDNFQADAWHEHHRVHSYVTYGTSPNAIQLVFTSKLSGRYYLALRCGQHMVRGFPVHTTIEAGPPDAGATSLVGARSSTLVLTSGIHDTIQIDAKDKFGNTVPKRKLPSLAERFGMKLLEKLGSSEDPSALDESVANFLIYHTPFTDTLCASIAFREDRTGWYRATVTLDGISISGTQLTLIVLSRSERAEVDQYVQDHNSLPSFEAELMAENGASLLKPKTVYCQLTPKQLTIKDYLFRFFPRKLYTFRMIPSTKLTLCRYHVHENAAYTQYPIIRVDDGYQGKPELLTKSGNILAAAYYLMLLKKMGGSESFGDKQTFFNSRLLKYHHTKGHKHSRLRFKIDRANIVADSYKATRWYSESDWCRLFEVEFAGELGIDHGGVRREWFEVLCKNLFHPSTGLFIAVEEGSEAVYPNPNLGQDIKPKMYKFAGRIVGKCLYESAYGVTYRQHLPVRLAKSFLVQLVGLRVHFRHFADDAPELYSSKIAFIADRSVEGLDLTFSEEEFAADGSLLRVVELKPGGAKVAVTDDNKLEYLDLLAQHRLCARIRDQTDQFLAGLHQFVPDSLLSLFDESELELLLCGVREYSLDDLRANHTTSVEASVVKTQRTIEWFWLSLASFTPEQFARLLQFATGSSQLPPGGFSELKPHFQIVMSAKKNQLPTAHTCSNIIRLPEYDSFKDFEKALLIAINEGSEGFGFA